MIAGTVTIRDDGEAVGHGTAKRLYDAMSLARPTVRLSEEDQPTSEEWRSKLRELVLKARRDLARQACELAQAARQPPATVLHPIGVSVQLTMSDEIVYVMGREVALTISLPDGAETGDEIEVVDRAGQAGNLYIDIVSSKEMVLGNSRIERPYGRAIVRKVTELTWLAF